MSREESIDWLCLPVFSDDSVFACILDPRGRCLSLRLAGPFSLARRYLDGTAVLETTFTTGTGVARVLDCLPVIDGVSGMHPLREVFGGWAAKQIDQLDVTRRVSQSWSQ